MNGTENQFFWSPIWQTYMYWTWLWMEVLCNFFKPAMLTDRTWRHWTLCYEEKKSTFSRANCWSMFWIKYPKRIFLEIMENSLYWQNNGIFQSQCLKVKQNCFANYAVSIVLVSKETTPAMGKAALLNKWYTCVIILCTFLSDQILRCPENTKFWDLYLGCVPNSVLRALTKRKN